MINDKNFRDKQLVQKILLQLQDEAKKLDHPIKIMHVCGTHEHEVSRWGIRSLLPNNISLIAGPGCPVCVCSAKDIDEVLWVAKTHDVTICTFGDMMRVPSSSDSLYQAQSKGVNVKVVYSISDAIKLAKKNPNTDYLFFSVGFETTACTTALEIFRTKLPNFSIYSSHKLIPPAMELLLQRDDIEFDGYLAPGHVSTIIGSTPYQICTEKYNFPVSIAGFEPVDILKGMHSLTKQIVNGEVRVSNDYRRYVKDEGNVAALSVMDKVFTVSSARWRGLGVLDKTGYEINESYSSIDAKSKYAVPDLPFNDLRGSCICDQVLIGKSKPSSCKHFMKSCTPENPIGACMVSHEGTCNIAATYEDILSKNLN